MRKSFLSISGIIVLGVIVLLINGISKQLFHHAYYDLTQDKLYSLSNGTKNILRSISDPITLKFYFSRTDSAKYPGLKLYGDRIADLLREYERLSNGNIKLESYDPRPDSDDEDWAQKYGLSPLPIRTGEQIFIGLAAVNASGSEEVIPLFDLRRQEFLEYDITKIIYSLNIGKKPVVAILSSLDLEGQAQPGRFGQQEESDGWFFVSQIAQVGDIRQLKGDISNVEADVNVLLLVHPKNLSEQTLYAIDQYVMRGGKLVVLEDPFCQADQPKKDPQNPMAGAMEDRSSSLNKLTSKWGVELIEKKVVGDLGRAAKIDAGRGDAYKMFILWPNLRKEDFNQNDVVTSSLENILLPWPGALKVSNVEGATVETLLKSSKESELAEETSYRFDGGDPDALLRNFFSKNEEYPFAVRVRGKLKSNYPNGKPAEQKDANVQQTSTSANAEHLVESKGMSNVIVVADVDFLSDRFSIAAQSILGTRLVSLLNDNLAFVQNSVENFLGSDDLISIRSRGQFTRTFSRVDAMEKVAQQRWQQEEMLLQAKLNGANQRLSQLQAASGGQAGEKQVITKAVLEEIKKFRDERKDAQQRLREVRRNLRQDIERLGEILFLVNTFLVPLLLIIATLSFFRTRREPKRRKA